METCNCSNIFKLKEPIGTCESDVIDLGFAATKTGEYILQTKFLNVVINIKKSFIIGEALKFPSAGLNESQEYLAIVTDPDKLRVIATSLELVEYNCFQFETKFILTL